jgi:UDP-N-acetylmuramoyl-tripeptide--D-alanyl-D-alanine ligase
LIPAVVVALLGGAAVASLRWLRIAQREHYLPGSAIRFAGRWWSLNPANVSLGAVGVAAAVATVVEPAAGFVTAAAVALGPLGLGVRGRTSPLAWTGRLRRLAAVVGVLVVPVGAVSLFVGPFPLAIVVMLLPLPVDAALALLAPLERRMGDPWVEKASRSLREVDATVVAITGSYGKTSTKGHVAHLVGGARRVLASPASFNNRMGLARAINEHLAGGIDVFVAEMGTYGPGEIADLCAWIPPDIAVITAIGPVHLERFGSEERIVEAKAEILADAAVAVLNVDDPRLAALAEREASRRRVIRVGTSDQAGLDVAVAEGRVYVGGRPVGSAAPAAHPSNLACAAGVAMALGLEVEDYRERLADVTEPEHRRTRARGTSGVAIIDDTFNSNPAGARAALSVLAAVPAEGRRVVVTPGMVELGRRQFDENRAFASAVAEAADLLIVVGRTNRSALLEGAQEADIEVREVASREEAVAWVRDNLGPADAVLYENDLPDHYP